MFYGEKREMKLNYILEMRKLRNLKMRGYKIFGALILFFFICMNLLALSFSVEAEGRWENKDNVWYYYPTEEEHSFTGWVQSPESARWYFIKEGKMQTGWMSWKGKWYFLNADGGMAEKQWVGNFYVGEDGAVLTDRESPDGWKLSANGSYLFKGKPVQELNEKTARYIKVLMEHPDARAIFDSPSQLTLEKGNNYPFIIFKKMSLYDPKTSALLYEGDAGFHNYAVLEYYNGTTTDYIRAMDLMQIRSISGKQVFIDPAGFITYVAGDKR